MSGFNYDVLDLEHLNQNPYCPHGPTVLFSNGNKKFYACSACRDHKLCSFMLEYNENKKISNEKIKFYYERYQEAQTQQNVNNELKNLSLIKLMSEEKRKYCKSCNQFIIEESIKNKHSDHQVLFGISDQMIEQPLLNILAPVEINSSNAQYVFDKKTIKLILNQIEKFSFDSVLCIGTPSIFENLNKSFPTVKRYLLDIDHRFNQFYNDDLFARYNLFNNHFFDPNNHQKYKKFIDESKNLFIIIDPPYGGIIKLIANTINSIKTKIAHNAVSVFLIYPYFNEPWVKKWLDDYRMLDYKVSYENQKKFSQNTKYKKGSPARIFTNIDLKNIELNEDEGYHYCKTCEKYTYKENSHCEICQTCPSKDGGFYKHCIFCKRCVKTSYNHCIKCNKCHLDSSKDCSINQDESFNLNLKSQKRLLHQNKMSKNKRKK